MAANKKLIIVESPAKAKTIGKFLGKGYKVIASQGHIRDLPKSVLGIDTENGFAMKYITIRGRGPILAQIRKEAKNASKILLATDPDREGEAISWHLAFILGIDPVSKCRIEFNEVTKTAVKEAITKPRAIDLERVDAQQARRALDRLVGYGISPLLWAKIKKGLSAGRVQSVATRMVVEREHEIDAFIPEEYWEISTQLTAAVAKGKKQGNLQAKLMSVDGEKVKINNEQQATEIENRIKKGKFLVDSVKASVRKRSPQPPFTTSSMQQDAGRKLKFSTSKTMQVVQQLYEGIDLGKDGTVGLVTYIRTDSVRISNEALDSVRSYISSVYGEDYVPEKANVYKGRKNAQDAHEAIRPTNINYSPEEIKAKLTRDQYRLYKLIYTRFIACQMKPALYDTESINILGDGIKLRCYGEHKKFAGYTAVYTESTENEVKEKDVVLPKLKKDDKIKIKDIEKSQHFTQAPPHFTEASLVRTLEEKGIGRPSTYAPTISTIIGRGYVSREKRVLYATELGEMVTDVMINYFNDIVDTDFTVSMENKLDGVEEGKVEWHSILVDFYPKFKNELDYAEAEIEKIEIKDEVSDIVCDKCGKLMVYKLGRYGKFLACPGFPECRNTKAIIEYIDEECPKCGSKIVKKRSKRGRAFYGCEKYPECDFVSWDKPVKEKCPECGSYMVEKHSRKGDITLLCANENCRHKIIKEKPEEDK